MSTSIAAIACGMPLPWAPGNQRRLIHASAANAAGINSSGSKGRPVHSQRLNRVTSSLP
jgi:hypothetical protein